MGYRDSDDTGFSRHGMGGSDHPGEVPWRQQPDNPERSGDRDAALGRRSRPAYAHLAATHGIGAYSARPMRIDYRAEGAYIPRECEEHHGPARRELEQDTGAASYSAEDHRYQDPVRQRREFEAQHAGTSRRGTLDALAPRHAYSATGRQHYDPDYLQWRDDHMHQLDDDYRAWCQERHQQFAEDFSTWRRARAERVAAGRKTPETSVPAGSAAPASDSASHSKASAGGLHSKSPGCN